jgi:hypothetical protein
MVNNFQKSFGNEDQKFYMNGDFKRMSSSYDNLVTIPNILGKKLPKELKIRRFTLVLVILSNCAI